MVRIEAIKVGSLPRDPEITISRIIRRRDSYFYNTISVSCDKPIQIKSITTKQYKLREHTKKSYPEKHLTRKDKTHLVYTYELFI